MKKFRVIYVESELGWGQEYWHEDYDTEEEALLATEDCNKDLPEFSVPDWYIKATYVGIV